MKKEKQLTKETK